MATIWRDSELSLGALRGKRVSIVGYGSQGRAHALNLRDSGVAVLVGVRHGPSWDAAVDDGFSPAPIEEACKADVISLMLPERVHREVIEGVINSHAPDGASLVFAHGYTVVYQVAKIRADLQLLLVAPKAIGPRLRSLYEDGDGAAALVAAEPGDIEVAKSYAAALGSGRAAVIQSPFSEETETDLFGEQAVLCGGMPALAMAAFDILVEAGYSPEVAYFECLFEIKLIADLMVERGIGGMIDSISDTAQLGAMMAGPHIVTPEVKGAMAAILSEIQDGKFARLVSTANESSMSALAEWRTKVRRHRLQEIHDELQLKSRSQSC